MATTTHQVNGLDVDALFNMIEEVKKNSSLAQCQFRARNKWINGGHNRARIRDFTMDQQMIEHAEEFNIELDEPPALLGEDKGLGPVECLLAALSGCVTTSMMMQAAAKGIELEEVESEYEGDLDLRGLTGISPDVRNGFQEIRMKFRIKSDASDEQLEEVVRLGQARSPVFEMVSASVPIRVSVDRK